MKLNLKTLLWLVLAVCAFFGGRAYERGTNTWRAHASESYAALEKLEGIIEEYQGYSFIHDPGETESALARMREVIEGQDDFETLAERNLKGLDDGVGRLVGKLGRPHAYLRKLDLSPEENKTLQAYLDEIAGDLTKLRSRAFEGME